ncbi:recombinase family protein [Dactylosporangium sp. NPDC051485]|uniref:recombinase family protein n=1 Tax=Dactylosporangium sp. NPDC051485 TaxID=3154846 RepID=UPI003441CAB4
MTAPCCRRPDSRRLPRPGTAPRPLREQPTHARVLQALKNPAYAGAYTFGKTRDVRRVQPDGSVRSARRKRAREEWTVVIKDHHEGSLTWPPRRSTGRRSPTLSDSHRSHPLIDPLPGRLCPALDLDPWASPTVVRAGRPAGTRRMTPWSC